MTNIDEMSINAIRVLSADAIQKANSGHPGLPLGTAPTAYELWTNHMNYNPADPEWENRDRFVLSGGHGSMLLYSLFHLLGIGNLSLDDVKNFRQMGSKTPGHPEYGHTVGVEATTGPLGAGMGMAVGMAIAERHMASVFNTAGYPVVDHYTYALGGDGCMMEGISSEAFSLAGTLKLSKLIIFYDSNRISIEGSTDIAFTENVQKRMEAFGFQTITVEDGNDLEAIGKAIEEAKADKTRPSFITVRTQIGYGCPAKQGKASAHGEPLGVDNVKAMREFLGWESEEAFYVPQEVYDNYNKLAENGAKAEEAWNTLFADYCAKYPELKALWDKYFGEVDAKGLLEDEEFWAYEDKAVATRALSGTMINRLKDRLPNLFGGSADLAPSNKTHMNDAGDFSKDDYLGRNLHFGVREFAMAAIVNGIQLHGGLISYGATFFVFSDYTKPMLRLASLMNLPVTMVFTHDSIGVGEDGPTHQPVEQLAMLRSSIDVEVLRPADANEMLASWKIAVETKNMPVALILTRQPVENLTNSTYEDVLHGAYIARKESGDLEGIIIASGSEVGLAIHAQEELEKQGHSVRVVSMPSMNLFDAQSDEYKESVLPNSCRKRLSVEMLSDFGWHKYVGLDGITMSIDEFGKSAPAQDVIQSYGFTVDGVVENIEKLLK